MTSRRPFLRMSILMFTALLAVFVLAACGRDDDDEPTPTPSAAAVSTEGTPGTEGEGTPEAGIAEAVNAVVLDPSDTDHGTAIDLDLLTLAATKYQHGCTLRPRWPYYRLDRGCRGGYVSPAFRPRTFQP